MIDQRNKGTQARVDKLTVEQMKKLITDMMKRDPSFVFHVMEENKSSLPSDPSPSASSPEWCKCQNCREMPTLLENVCCQGTPETCVSKLPEFAILIPEPMVLNMTNNYRNDFLGMEEEEDLNKSFRNAAYRQFVLWRSGYLGANNRKVIQSCCVLAVRDKYPSPHSIYTGYKIDRLA